MSLRSNNYLTEVPKPKEKREELKALIELIESSKTDSAELIRSLIDVIEKIKPQAISMPEPSVTVNMDVERIIKAMPKTPKQEAPVVNMDLGSLKEMMEPKAQTAPESYAFEIQRDGHGRMKTIIAKPLGGEL